MKYKWMYIAKTSDGGKLLFEGEATGSDPAAILEAVGNELQQRFPRVKFIYGLYM